MIFWDFTLSLITYIDSKSNYVSTSEKLALQPLVTRAAAAASGAPPGRGGGEGGGDGKRNDRRRIDRFEIVHRRPEDVVTKSGKDGQPIRLITNFFRVKTTPKWRIAHYHVDFSPDIEMVQVRCGILSNHAAILGTGYLFDGKQLFTTIKFEQDVTVLQSRSKQDVDYKITIKFVGFVKLKFLL
ncbi:hypothetical protein ACLKA6_011357 [Drosophila palustris]